MPLVTSTEMLKSARKNGTAIGAFNIENMEMAQAVIAGAEEVNSPIILQTTPSTLRYAPPNIFAAMVTAMAQNSPVAVAMHLEHGSSFEQTQEALCAGYSSIMIDGSSLPFKENVALAVKVKKISKDIPVEAELGSIGGKEDDLDVAKSSLTDPEKAAEFVSLTGIDSLAIAIGTAHGVYSGTPVLDIKRLKEIRKVVSVPLVLHGASGLSLESVRNCISEGICKVNFATELRIAYSDGVKEYLCANPESYDPKTYGKAGFNRVKQLVIEKIRMVS